MSALYDSKLIDQIGAIRIGISGENKNQVIEYIQEKGVEYQLLEDANSDWEQQTLIPLHDFAKKKNQGVIFYAHTKGASSSNSYSLGWRTSMTFFNIIQWKINISYLKEFDIVGCHWIDSRIEENSLIPPFFGGNFWWANCTFISRLQTPTNLSRWDAETWLTSNFEKEFPKFKDVNPGWPNEENFIFGW